MVIVFAGSAGLENTTLYLKCCWRSLFEQTYDVRLAMIKEYFVGYAGLSSEHTYFLLHSMLTMMI